ncbi:MAG: TonB-dependent receptor-like protein [Gammaproteobacteria bacterium]|nr:TonB-dependent receptor-like protein [Gammaproteobacteria bacterium]
MTKVRAHVALTIASTMSALALAQSAAFAQAAAAPTADAGDTLQEIVVTAQFRSEKLQETPLAITAVSGDAMEARNMQSLLDIAKIAPNVTMFEASAPFGKTNAAFIRGIGQGDFNLAAGEPGVGVYVDDVYYASTFGSVVDLLDLERVEVLRGPQGTLFGKNSIGGAVRMISKKPTGDGSGYLEATVGDYNTRYIKGAYDTSIVQDKLFLRVSVMSKQKDGYVNRVDYACAHPDLGASQGYVVNPAATNLLKSQMLGSGSCIMGTEGGENIAGARASLRWVINDSAENTLTASVVDDKSEAAPEVLLYANDHDPARPAPLLAAYNSRYILPTYGVNYDNRFVTNDYRTTYSNFYDTRNNRAIPPVSTLHSYGVSDVLDWDVAGGVHIKLISAYTGYWGDFSDDQDNSPLPIAYAYNLLDHHQETEELQITGKAFGNKVDWATGAFYFDGYSLNRGHINLSFFSAGAPLPNNGLDFNQNSPAKDKNYAVFFQPTFHVTDQMDIIAGARWTHEKKEYTYFSFFGQLGPYATSYSHADWKAAINYRWTPDFMTYASATTGFRGGGFNPRPFSAAQINSFGPEKLTEYEVGMKSEWFDHRLRANLAAFYGLYRNMQLNSQVITAGIPYTGIQNIPGGANISGGEFELEAQPIGGLTVSLSGGYTDFKYKLGNSVGCQDLGVAGISGVNCISGNPGSGDIPTGRPKFKANLGVGYAIALPAGGKLTPRLDLTGQSETFADVQNHVNPLARMPGRALLDGRVTWDSPDGKWSVAGFGTNLTNRKYYVSIFDLTTFGEGQVSGQPGAPREWGVTTKYNFGK